MGVGFQLATSSSAASVGGGGGGSNGGASVAATAAGLTIDRGTDKIVITKAQLVLRDVKLKTAVATCSDDDDDDDKRAGLVLGSAASASSRSDDDDDDDDDKDCPTIRVGPFLVDIPVSGADAQRIAVLVPEGTYSKVRLTVHKVTGSDSAGRRFREANPDFRDLSIRLQGTFNGRAFTFANDVEAKIEVPMTAPLRIKEGGDNVTVTLDLAPWFVNPAGGLYNPADANAGGQVRAKVQNAIRTAFKAFRDKNRDGKED